MNSLRQTFKKTEHLCSRKIITSLFESGNSFYTSGFKILWGISSVIGPFPAQVMFSVSKRSFKHAVSRNLIKRRMREAYRKQKYILYDYLNEADLKLAFIVLYKMDKIQNQNFFDSEIRELLENLVSTIKIKTKKC